MPIFEKQNNYYCKEKERKKKNLLGQPTLPLYTLLRVYNITTKCWQIFFANFLAISFLPVDINDLDFFQSQDFWVLSIFEPSYKMPSCNV